MSQEQMKSELAGIESRLRALEVGKYHMGFCVGSIPLEKLFSEHLSAKVLGQIQDRLNKYPDAISEEAHGWLEEARANLAQFSEYMLALEEKLIARAEEIEEALWDTEQTQSEMNADAERSI